MKLFFLTFLFLLLFGCKPVECLDPAACAYFENTYRRIEGNYDKRYSKTTIYSEDYDFIYAITGVQSEYIEGIELLYTPSKKSLKIWKRWYKYNKDKLYWDESEKKVKLRK
ncbi:MAG: hypothetical protein LBI72_09890 [Flavobacteriaceae bacterium]|jgi:hypothetical protein|nr:hypothetical protein [Flavobacteriaceae bacterium]